MALVLNEEQAMLRDSALGFLREQAPTSQLRSLRDSRDEAGFSRDLWREFAKLGFAGVLVPQAYGGSGLGIAEAGVVMEAIGRTLAAAPFFSTAIVAAHLIARHGSEAQRREYLPGIADGTRLMALAVDEHTRHRPQDFALTATVRGEGFVLNGSKTFVVDGHVADTLIVAARDERNPEGVSLLLVARDAPGVSVERTVMVDSRNAARVRFDNVQVGSLSLVGASGEGWPLLEHTLDAARAALASELLGLSDEVCERTFSYLKERRQFGKLIGEYQALQHRAATLYTEVELTRALVLHAQQAFDSGASDAAAIVSAAKARAGSTVTLAVQEGVQMHGGIGMTDELDIGLYMKRARVAQELMGDTCFHAARWARAGGY
ncbi:Acyl-CoA dehydrogenase [Paraburkholderia caffeinitolerans]|uniref:Acyl-CoA dehydrogenase n=1 Tax=Paraburkholderia caffeinitolerans TaxID=1723730 RepID=A0A6J5FGQ6_9BURK|nr:MULTISPECIES: acyl-CoA dehydrogenase family protein [Paraburkholderia]CAB3777543.1 Acyl-CoA dehydrogenase [Paraburkholderia caffeinitolerans]